jgi:hypothetical protein
VGAGRWVSAGAWGAGDGADWAADLVEG